MSGIIKTRFPHVSRRYSKFRNASFIQQNSEFTLKVGYPKKQGA